MAKLRRTLGLFDIQDAIAVPKVFALPQSTPQEITWPSGRHRDFETHPDPTDVGKTQQACFILNASTTTFLAEM
jgi:hypothetical protein